MTKVESRTHQHGRRQASETNIVRRDMHICSPIRCEANTLWTNANLVAHILTLNRWTLQYYAHQRWSFPFHQNLRRSSERTSMQSWRLDNPLQCGAHVNNPSGLTMSPRADHHIRADHAPICTSELRVDHIVTALEQTQPTWCILALQWWDLFIVYVKTALVVRHPTCAVIA